MLLLNIMLLMCYRKRVTSDVGGLRHSIASGATGQIACIKRLDFCSLRVTLLNHLFNACICCMYKETCMCMCVYTYIIHIHMVVSILYPSNIIDQNLLHAKKGRGLLMNQILHELIN